MITAIWLRQLDGKAQVLVEINKKWRMVIEETCDSPFSHIAEVVDDGSRWPIDLVTEDCGRP